MRWSCSRFVEWSSCFDVGFGQRGDDHPQSQRQQHPRRGRRCAGLRSSRQRGIDRVAARRERDRRRGRRCAGLRSARQRGAENP